MLRITTLLVIIMMTFSICEGQVVLKKGKTFESTVMRSGDFLIKLKENHDKGIWDEVRASMESLIADLSSGNPNQAVFANHGAYYSVIFLAPDLKGKPALVRFLYHKNFKQFILRLPGIETGKAGNFHELFLTFDPGVRLVSTYISTEQADPLLGQIPGFVKKFEPSVVSPLLPRAEERLKVELTQIELEHKRASIEVKDLVVVQPAIPTVKAITTTAEQVNIHQALFNSCGRQLSDKLKTTLADAVSSNPNSTNAGLKEAVGKAYADFLSSAKCSSSDVESLVAVEAQYTQIVAKQPEYVELSWKFTNIPFTRLSFGFSSAFILGNDVSDPRAKAADGVLAEDPISGALTMGILNIAFRPYDLESLKMTNNERFRGFVGGILTPEFGFGGGIGVGLVRGLSLNFGAGLMFIDTLKKDEEFGKAPKDKADPFDTGTASVYFIGIAYNL